MLQSKVDQMMQAYSSPENFLLIFNPSLQPSVLSNQSRAFTGTAPTLTTVKAGYGDKITIMWIMAQLENLNTFCGVKEKATFEQLEEFAKLITVNYSYLKITELMLFFAKFKLGQYGTFYGVVDPIVVTSALLKFMDERLILLNKFEKEQESIRKQEIEQKRKRFEVDRETWELIKSSEYIRWLWNS